MWMRLAIGILAYAALSAAADPVRTAWIMGPAGVPVDVRSVEASGSYIVVHSSGITLHYLGPLQEPPVPNERASECAFRIPREPAPQTGRHTRVPVGIVGKGPF